MNGVEIFVLLALVTFAVWGFFTMRRQDVFWKELRALNGDVNNLDERVKTVEDAIDEIKF